MAMRDKKQQGDQRTEGEDQCGVVPECIGSSTPVAVEQMRTESDPSDEGAQGGFTGSGLA